MRLREVERSPDPSMDKMLLHITIEENPWDGENDTWILNLVYRKICGYLRKELSIHIIVGGTKKRRCHLILKNTAIPSCPNMIEDENHEGFHGDVDQFVAPSI